MFTIYSYDLTLNNSDITTAVVAMNMSPSRIRTCRMTSISKAFCKVSNTNDRYFRNVGFAKIQQNTNT